LKIEIYLFATNLLTILNIMAAALPIRTNFHPDAKHSELSRWICIYPAFINSKKTRQDGRRLPKENCVENPTYIELRDVLSVTKLKFAVENKQYPRERSRELNYRGRIRVQLKNDDGTLCDPEFPTRESVMLYCASKIPQLKSRQSKSGNDHSNLQLPANVSGGGGSGGGGGGNRKGKGKRR